METETDPRLLALVAWYRDIGVSDALTDEPVDWLARGDDVDASFGLRKPSATPPPSAPPQQTGNTYYQSGVAPPEMVHARGPRTFPAIAPAAAEQAANAEAASARTLDELRAKLEQFDGCALKATAKNLCFYRGAAQARLMIIGEAPGRDEDLEGKPFVGRAGQLLNRMLAAVDLDENAVHITNIVYWRPPGNRTPTPQEALVCRPFLMRQIELVAPDMLLLLGGAAAKSIFNITDGILRVRGKWRQVEVASRTLPAIATLHPAYLLRTPIAKRQAWRDLLATRVKLDENRPGRPN